MLTTDRMLLHPTDEELGRAIEDNLYALFRAMASLPGAELVQTPELGRHCAPPAPTPQACVDATLALGFDRAPWRLFLARLDGDPVATALILGGGGVAGVYAVGTVERARGKGIGGAITLAPLLESRDEGYRHAVLFSSQIGVGA